MHSKPAIIQTGIGAPLGSHPEQGFDYDFSINPEAEIRVIYSGKEQQPIIIVDNLLNNPQSMLACALESVAQQGLGFTSKTGDFYPGIKKTAPEQYATSLAQVSFAKLLGVFGLSCTATPKKGDSAFSITTTEPDKLLPIQSIPHFDTSAQNHFAVVHYLCQPEHGGTSFYRHRQTGYESINTQRQKTYTRTLEREATTVGLPKPQYVNGDSDLFERVVSVEAKFNRALFYRSNLLHSGDIRAHRGLSSDPGTGRLTVTTALFYQ